MAVNGLTYDDLQHALSEKKFSPVYLLFGEEDFLAEEATQSIIDAALTVEERGFNLDVLYGSEADAREIILHALSFPMIAERRVVVVREVDKLPNKELLSSYLDNPSPTTSLILVSTKPDFRKKPYVTAKRSGNAFEFRPLFENQVPAWVTRRVKQQGKDIEGEASRMLTVRIGTSLREIQNELDKLYIFVGERKLIKEADVRAVVGVSKEFNIFELQKAMGGKDMGRSIEIMERMLEAGETGTMIVFMLTRFYLALWRLTEMQRKGNVAHAQAGILNVSPFFLREYQEAIGHYSSAEIERSFELLAEADEQLKFTSIEPKQVMHTLVVRLLNESVAVIC
jgi:DNA polymerase-3 subunit delta